MASPLTLACQDASLDDVVRQVYGAHFTTATRRPFAIARDRYSYDAVADMVDDGATRWDVCKTDATECALLGRAGLLASIDWKLVDRAAAPASLSVPWWGVPCHLYSYVVAFDHAALSGAVPNGWKGLWDTTTFPGKRVIPSASVSGLCEAALMSTGIPPAHLYPLDVDRALARLRLLRDQMLFAGDDAQAAGLMLQGAAPLGFLRSTTATLLRTQTQGRIDFTWTQAILSPSLLMVPKEAPAGADAMRFIAATQNPAIQIEMLRRAGCGPVNPAARAALTPDLAQLDPGSTEHRAIGVTTDAPWYLANMRSLQPRWAAFIAG